MRLASFAAVLVITTSAAAQDSTRALGPWFDAHYTYASGTTIDGAIPFQPYTLATSSGSGGGVTIGYGFFRWLSAYVTLDHAPGQSVTATGIPVTGSLALDQVDAGLRLEWALTKIHLTPYALVAYSSRTLTGSVRDTTHGGNGTYSTWGSATTFGAGAEYFFANAFSADVQYAWSNGGYGRVSLTNDVKFSTGASSSSSSRVLAGVTWHAGPQRSHAAPENPTAPLEVGQQVRVHAGTKVVAGKLTVVGRDTLIVQEVVKGMPVQTAVPVACIASVERHRPPRPIGPDLINGAMIGGIAGGFWGAVEDGGGTDVPKTPAQLTADYILPGALAGAAVGATINLVAKRWEAVAPLPQPAMEPNARYALCAPWTPTT